MNIKDIEQVLNKAIFSALIKKCKDPVEDVLDENFDLESEAEEQAESVVNKSKYEGYTSSDNVKRKQTRTSETRDDAGQNKAVRRYTTSGSQATQHMRDKYAKQHKKQSQVKEIKPGDKEFQEVASQYEKSEERISQGMDRSPHPRAQETSSGSKKSQTLRDKYAKQHRKRSQVKEIKPTEEHQQYADAATAKDKKPSFEKAERNFNKLYNILKKIDNNIKTKS